MMVESFFVRLCKSLDFAGHSIHFQVSVEVTVSNVPGCIDKVPEYFVLEGTANVCTYCVFHCCTWVALEDQLHCGILLEFQRTEICANASS